MKTNRLIGAFLPQMKVATTRPVTTAGGQIYPDFDTNWQKIMSGQTSAKAGMLATAAAWKAKLFPDYVIVTK